MNNLSCISGLLLVVSLVFSSIAGASDSNPSIRRLLQLTQPIGPNNPLLSNVLLPTTSSLPMPNPVASPQLGNNLSPSAINLNPLAAMSSPMSTSINSFNPLGGGAVQTFPAQTIAPAGLSNPITVGLSNSPLSSPLTANNLMPFASNSPLQSNVGPMATSTPLMNTQPAGLVASPFASTVPLAAQGANPMGFQLNTEQKHENVNFQLKKGPFGPFGE
jgi:hypothetical protein